ncbi:bacteriohemerythrin [Sulfurisoma sediminicola]|uniref:Hemerythrin n=1 Tax=Sulfurisoma sediminicola TaxID=1381557 RepID=A0A497XD25_9PROT|nr:hemerythrin family protein [Sulfurisoma sediminicola]RLJ64853.1 hemerythrin [Sulfurisoma sediminicola]
MPHSSSNELAAGEVMDREHQVQTGLVEALCNAVERGEDASKVEEILDRLLAYTSAHFMSEELLMRLASYDDYEDHVADHIRAMDELDAILSHHRAGQPALMLEKARAIDGFLRQHIATRDARFAAWAPPRQP